MFSGFQCLVGTISEKPLAHESHLAMTLLKLSEIARKLQKTDKNIRILWSLIDWNFNTARVNQVYS